MFGNAGTGRGRTRLLTLVVGLAVISALVAGLVGLRATAAQSPPEELSDQELLTRMSQAPENAPDFRATLTVEQSLVPDGLLGAGSRESLGDAARTARVWYGGQDRLRAELQGDTGDQVFVRNGSEVSLYDGATNTVRTAENVPAPEPTPEEAITPAEIGELLDRLSETSDLTQETSQTVAGRPSYVLNLTPQDRSTTLIESAQMFVDAETYLPLRVLLYVEGQADPVFSWETARFETGPVADERFEFETPPGAEVLPLEEPAREGQERPEEMQEPQEVESVEEAQEGVGFGIREPQSLPGGRELTDVKLAGEGVLLTYGSGWGTVVLAQGPEGESPEIPGAGNGAAEGSFDEFQIPTVDLGGGVEAQEISSPAGTALTWSVDGVSYALAGSVPADELRQVARDLR